MCNYGIFSDIHFVHTCHYLQSSTDSRSQLKLPQSKNFPFHHLKDTQMATQFTCDIVSLKKCPDIEIPEKVVIFS